MGRKLTEEEKAERKRIKAEIRKRRKELKRAENRRKWRRHLTNKYYHMRLQKRKANEREMSGDKYGLHRVIITKNRKHVKTLGYCWWSLKANEMFNKAIEKNRREVMFPKRSVTIEGQRHSHTKPIEYEILLIRRVDDNFNPDEIEVMRDDNGKIIRRVIEGREDTVVVRRDEWYVEETFYVSGHDPKKDRKDYRYIKDVLIGRSLSGENMKRVMTYKNNLVIITDENVPTMIKCKNRSDSKRLYEKLFNETDRRSVHFVGEAGTEMVPIILNMEEAKTGRDRNSIGDS